MYWKIPSNETLKRVGGLVALLIFGALVYFGFRDIDRIKELFLAVRWHYLLSASLVYAVGLILSVVVLHRLYLQFDVNVPFWRTFYIAFLSLLGRYIPGKLWIIGFASYISRSIGRDPVRVFWASIVNQAISIISIIPFAFFLYWRTRNPYILMGGILLSAASIGGSWWIFRRNKIAFGGFKFLLLSGVYFASWLLTGVAFLLFYRGMGLSGDPGVLVSVFPVSYLIGLLSFFAPGGLGIRELSLSYFLSAYLEPSSAAAVGVMFRLLTTLVEFLLSAVAYLMYMADRPED